MLTEKKRSRKSQDIEELSAFSDDTIGMCDNGKLFSGIFRRKCWKIFFVLSNQDPSGHDCINTQRAQDPGRLSARNHRNSLSGQECGTMIGRTFFCIVTGEQPKTGRSGSYSNLIATRDRDQGARAFRKICLFSIPGRKFRYLIGARKKYKNAKLDKTLPKLCQKYILCLFFVMG